MGDSGRRALDGLRVVELSIAIAAPTCGRAFAFHGADVIKLESRAYPDVARLFGSAWARTPEHAPVFWETSPYVAEMSASKRSVGLELKDPAAVDAARRLVATADVFLTNYSTPAVQALGLGPEELHAVKPDLVYLAMPGFGSEPSLPYYEFISWGPNQAPLVGLDALTGFGDQEPAGVAAVAVPDYVAGVHAMMAVLTALEHRDATGEGSFVDLSQFEVTVSVLGPWLLDYALTGEVASRDGNRVPWAAPQGTYRCRGADAWVALTIDDDASWAALAGLVGGPVGPGATLAERVDAHDAIDAAVAAWTSQRSPAEAAEQLQRAGVAAYHVLDDEALLVDPQVRDREWYQVRASSRFPGGDLFSTSALRLGDTPGDWWRAGPSMGEDTVEVLRDVAGYDDEAIAALVASGAAFTAREPQRVLQRPYEAYMAAMGLRRGQ